MNAKTAKALERRLRKMAGEGNPFGERWAPRVARARANGELAKLEPLCREMWSEVATVVQRVGEAYPAISQAVGGTTGMTLEDFIWLRDYAPLDEGHTSEGER